MAALLVFRKMISYRRLFSVITLVSLLASAALTVMTASPLAPMSGAIYYVASNGNDSNPGTESLPWRTIQRAAQSVTAGDTIYMRGGIYYETNTIQLSMDGPNGNTGNMIKLWNYPGETPVFDFMNAPNGIRGVYFANKHHWHIKGIELRNIGQSADGGFFIGFFVNNANDNIFENLDVHHMGNLGFRVAGTSTGNLILNSDFHHNYDPYTYGGNADGLEFNCNEGTINTVRGCRFWLNSDDGLDLWDTEGKIIAENNWSFWNGYYVPEGQPDSNRIHPSSGDGNGFKLGRTLNSSDDPSYRIVVGNLAFENWLFGITQNQARKAMTIYNNTVYNNGAPESWGGGFWVENYDLPHIIRNNIAYKNRRNWPSPNDPSIIQDHNSWNLGFDIADDDFESLDSSGADGPRKPDGSLPDLPFLKLESTSNLIDAGIDVGFPYNGSAPDIGAYEYVSGTQPTATPTPTPTLTPTA